MGFGRVTSAISAGVLTLAIGGGMWLLTPATAFAAASDCAGQGGLLSGVAEGLCKTVSGLAETVGGVGALLTGRTGSSGKGAERDGAEEEGGGTATGNAPEGDGREGARDEPGMRATPSPTSLRASAGPGGGTGGGGGAPGDEGTGATGGAGNAGDTDGTTARDATGGADGACARAAGRCAKRDGDGAGRDGGRDARGGRSPGREAAGHGGGGAGGPRGGNATGTGPGTAGLNRPPAKPRADAGGRRTPKPSPSHRPRRVDKAELPLLWPGPTLPPIAKRVADGRTVKPSEPYDDVLATTLTVVLLLSAVLAARVVSIRSARRERRPTIPLEPGGPARGRRHRLA